MENKKEKSFNKGIIVIIIMVLITIIAFVLEGHIYGENSVFNKSISNNTYIDLIYNKIPCLIKSIQIVTIAWVINKVSTLIFTKNQKNSKRGKTIGKLLSSFIKYIVAIIAIVYVLSAWGTDTSSLISGMGILALIIGLGSQSLIADIVAGIFIVFEGDFQVGDIVVIDGFCGMISEVGIRTTKIEDDKANLKILNNSKISTVIN